LRAYPEREEQPGVLVSGGEYQWRADGERHLFNPLTIHKLQAAVRSRDGDVWPKGYKTFQEYSGAGQRAGGGPRHAARHARTWADNPVPLDEVESVETIVRRFKTGAMSYGSISRKRTRRWQSP
jgi:glutamate synthase (NADPH/NADH) large chain